MFAADELLLPIFLLGVTEPVAPLLLLL